MHYNVSLTPVQSAAASLIGQNALLVRRGNHIGRIAQMSVLDLQSSVVHCGVASARVGDVGLQVFSHT